MTDLRYPIGEFTYRGAPDSTARAHDIERIAAHPAALRAALGGLASTQLDTPYRPGGWTIRQVAHHLPDSHLNAYVRLKLALTEERPVIKPYEEAAWALLPDSTRPVETALALVEALHDRWVALLRALAPNQFERTFYHPARQEECSLDWLVAFYAWHGEHHVAHIADLRRREGW